MGFSELFHRGDRGTATDTRVDTLDSEVVADRLLRMSERCERLVAQQAPLGPDEEEQANPTYTYGQVYAMMAGTQSAEEIIGPGLAPASARGLAAAMKELAGVAATERAEYFFIGALAYLIKYYESLD
jgi:hypothetical protein